MSIAAVRHDDAVDHARAPVDEVFEAPAAEARSMIVRIDQGLVMVLGPEGDPVPPRAFIAGASADPDAVLQVEGGTGVPAARLAAVLEAQSRGALAPTGPEGLDWLRAMLGDGPMPASADAADHAAETGHDLTIFGDEILIRTPGDRIAILGARAGASDEPALQIAGPDGEPLDQRGLVQVLSALAMPADQGPGGMAISGCRLSATEVGLVLTTPMGLRYSLLPAESDAVDPALARLMTLDGEVLPPAEIAGALGLAREPGRGEPGQPQGPAAVRPEAGPAEGGASADPQPVLAGPRGLPARLELGADGILDLSLLHQVLADLDPTPHEVALSGLPDGVRLSAGVVDEAGVWRFEVPDTRRLTLFATPEGLETFTLRIVASGHAAPVEHAIEVVVGRDEGSTCASASASAPSSIPLVFPPPLSPRNDLSFFAVVMITGLPAGAALSAGAADGSGRWALMPDDLPALRAHLPAGTQLPCVLTATGITIEDREGMMSSASASVAITADALEPGGTEPVRLEVVLDLGPLLGTVKAGRRIRAVAVAGLPPVVELSAGAFDPAAGCWVVRRSELPDLRALIGDPLLGRLTFKATVISTGPDDAPLATSRAFDLPLSDAGPVIESRPGTARPPGFFRPLRAP